MGSQGGLWERHGGTKARRGGNGADVATKRGEGNGATEGGSKIVENRAFDLL